MQKLISKIQYKNFEPGEFIDEKERTIEEVEDLIEKMPWEKEREQIVIDLTCTSITVQNSRGQYLKLALYYNGKFVLHLISEDDKLYKKSLNKYKDSYADIRRFYKQDEFDISGFKLENTWLKNNLHHFITKDFHYFVTPRSAWSFLFKTSWPCIIFVLMFLYILISGKVENSFFAKCGLYFFIFLYGGGINAIFFLNYYKKSKGRLLLMTKGNNIFYFGSIDNPDKYSKADIEKIIVHIPKSNGFRGYNPIGSFNYVDLILKNGVRLTISNMLINPFNLKYKLYSCITEEKRGILPYIN